MPSIAPYPWQRRSRLVLLCFALSLLFPAARLQADQGLVPMPDSVVAACAFLQEWLDEQFKHDKEARESLQGPGHFICPFDDAKNGKLGRIYQQGKWAIVHIGDRFEFTWYRPPIADYHVTIVETRRGFKIKDVSKQAAAFSFHD